MFTWQDRAGFGRLRGGFGHFGLGLIRIRIRILYYDIIYKANILVHADVILIIARALSWFSWSIIFHEAIRWSYMFILFQGAQYLCVPKPHPPTPCSNLIWSWHGQRLKLEQTLANSGQPSEPAGDEIYSIRDFFLWAKNGMNRELSILSLLFGWNLQLQYLDLIQWWIFILSHSFIQTDRNNELWYDMKITPIA